MHTPEAPRPGLSFGPEEISATPWFLGLPKPHGFKAHLRPLDFRLTPDHWILHKEPLVPPSLLWILHPPRTPRIADDTPNRPDPIGAARLALPVSSRCGPAVPYRPLARRWVTRLQGPGRDGPPMTPGSLVWTDIHEHQQPCCVRCLLIWCFADISSIWFRITVSS